jgi:hypothetical protein
MQLPDPAAFMSAPVSRGEVGRFGRDHENNPSRVRLTVEEKALAKASGVSELEWARGKLRLQHELVTGQRQR